MIETGRFLNSGLEMITLFIKDAKLVIHNAKFDIGFINNEF